MARNTIATTRGQAQVGGGGSWKDRAFHPNRRVGPDNRPADESYATPKVTLNGGKPSEVGDLNWMKTNAQYAERVDYNRSPAADWDAIMSITGNHPESGTFQFEVGWRDSDNMRSWVGKTLPEIPVGDRLRDGGYGRNG